MPPGRRSPGPPGRRRAPGDLQQRQLWFRGDNVDVNAGRLRRRRGCRLLDGRLNRSRGRPAAVAAGLQAQVDDALVVDALELDLARVRAELRHDRLDRALD